MRCRSADKACLPATDFEIAMISSSRELGLTLKPVRTYELRISRCDHCVCAFPSSRDNKKNLPPSLPPSPSPPLPLSLFRAISDRLLLDDGVEGAESRVTRNKCRTRDARRNKRDARSNGSGEVCPVVAPENVPFIRATPIRETRSRFAEYAATLFTERASHPPFDFDAPRTDRATLGGNSRAYLSRAFVSHS